MEALARDYASDASESDSEGSAGVQDAAPPNPRSSVTLPPLPAEVAEMFADSDYDLQVERERAAARRGDTRWQRNFQHERGNWPAHIYIPVPNSAEFVSLVEASVQHLQRRLARAWEAQKRQHPPSKRRRTRAPGGSYKGGPAVGSGPPEVVVNDLSPSATQHLSLSRPFVLRRHHVMPFVKGLRGALSSTQDFLAVVTGEYDVLVNDEGTRSFLSLRVVGGRQHCMNLIRKADAMLEKYQQPVYYEEPKIHVSVASMQGDVVSMLREAKGETSGGGGGDDGGGGGNDEQEEGDEEEDELCTQVDVEVSVVICKVADQVFDVQLAAGPGAQGT